MEKRTQHCPGNCLHTSRRHNSRAAFDANSAPQSALTGHPITGLSIFKSVSWVCGDPSTFSVPARGLGFRFPLLTHFSGFSIWGVPGRVGCPMPKIWIQLIDLLATCQPWHWGNFSITVNRPNTLKALSSFYSAVAFFPDRWARSPKRLSAVHIHTDDVAKGKGSRWHFSIKPRSRR